MTEVGQSGPPHMIDDFASERPGFSSSTRMPFISLAFGLTMARIDTLDPSGSPISFCCRTCATSLSTYDSRLAQAQARRKGPCAAGSPGRVHPLGVAAALVLATSVTLAPPAAQPPPEQRPPKACSAIGTTSRPEVK